jgi:hypothetical protein
VSQARAFLRDDLLPNTQLQLGVVGVRAFPGTVSTVYLAGAKSVEPAKSLGRTLSKHLTEDEVLMRAAP